MLFDCAKCEVESVDLPCSVMDAGDVHQGERHRFLLVDVFAVLGSLPVRVLGGIVFLLFFPNDLEGRLGVEGIGASTRRFVLGFLAVGGALLGGLFLAGAPALAAACPNEQFRIGPSAALPDCRAYEMVSPPDKNGGQVDGGITRYSGLAAPEQAAGDGEAVTYASASAFVGVESESAGATSQYLSTRTAGGWVTRGIVPTQQFPEGRLETNNPSNLEFSLFQGFNEDLGDGFLLAWNPQPDPSAPAGYYNPYLREAGSGEYQLLSEGVTPSAWQPGGAGLEGPGFAAVYAGMSADGRHVIFEANDALTAEAVPGRGNLYEWSAGRPLELVSVLPEGTVDTAGGAHPLGGPGAMTFGSTAVAEFPYDYSGALSSNGMRAFWSGGNSTGNQIYVHEITESGPRTVDLSASQKSGAGNAPATYWTANPEGSLVYFTSAGQLTATSTASPEHPDLYQYDVNTGALSDLTVDSGEAANVLSVLGTGETEGVAYVYFAAGGVLAGNANSEGEKAAPQSCLPAVPNINLPATPCNLYVYHEGQTAFIATLGGSYEGEESDFAAGVMERTSRVSPDGRSLAFQSVRPLTGYDNIPADGQPCPEPTGNEGNTGKVYRSPPEGRCMEVFEYDAQTAKVVCVSCDPSGLPTTADSLVPETLHQLGNIQGWESSTVQQRYLLDDGRLLFQSEDALLPEATDGRQNVYEYEPEGVGQCAATGTGSCLYLISTGEGSGNSYFADASSDGRDVFFLTDQQLVPQDGDEAIDMYDAREGGGFSSAVPPPCAGEACKPAVTPAPAIYGAPSSATFEGAGDVPAQPAVTPAAVKQSIKKKPAKKKKKAKKKKRRGMAGGARKSSRRSERGRR